jgi:uncharacterized protein YdaU (DUF1376 family)
MALKIIYYPRYPADYARDTSRLRIVHHGAYALLLDDYYLNGPLPEDIQALYAICRANTDEERQAVAWVAETYFPVNGDSLRHNKRADIERAKIERISAANSGKAKSRWGKR